MKRHLGAAALAVVVLAGCGGSTASSPDTLARVVDASLSATGAVGSASGPMDLALAASATTVPRPMLEKFLHSRGFRVGYSRVWSASGELTSALDYRFSTTSSATAFVGYVADRLATSAYNQSFSDPALPGSRGFELVSRVRGTTQFCVGELFAVATDAFVVTRCAPYPLGPSAVSPLAQQQRAHAISVSS